MQQKADADVVAEHRSLPLFNIEHAAYDVCHAGGRGTTFCDDTIRVSRDQDDNVFVYRKVSSSTEPRAFDDAPSDLNVGSLVAGFVDSFSWI